MTRRDKSAQKCERRGIKIKIWIAVISTKCQSEYKIAADTVTSVRMCQRYYEK